MAITLEDDDANVGHPASLRLGDGVHVLRRRGVDVDRADCVGARGDLLHIKGPAGKKHRPALRRGDHRDRVRLSERGQPRALERVDSDVDLRASRAHVLAVEQHRRLVLLPLADHDDAVHRDRVEHRAHGIDGRLVGGNLVAAADPPAGAHGGGFGDADELESEVAVGTGRAHRE